MLSGAWLFSVKGKVPQCPSLCLVFAHRGVPGFLEVIYFPTGDDPSDLS